MTVPDNDDPRDPLDDKPLWRLEDLLLQCFQADELERILARKYPAIASEMPVASNSPAHFVHAVVALLDRHGLVGTLLFANLLEWRPLRRAQILSAAAALSLEAAEITAAVGEGAETRIFRSPFTVAFARMMTAGPSAGGVASPAATNGSLDSPTQSRAPAKARPRPITADEVRTVVGELAGQLRTCLTARSAGREPIAMRLRATTRGTLRVMNIDKASRGETACIKRKMKKIVLRMTAREVELTYPLLVHPV